MKKLFSRKLYLQGLHKIRVSGIAMTVVLLVLNAWIPIQYMTKSFSMTGTPSVTVDVGEFAPFGFALMLFAPLLVYNMFSYLNERRSSDLFHSLPQKRICIYVSFAAAVVTWIVFALCTTSLLNTILWSLNRYYAVPLTTVVSSFASFLLLAAVMMGFMALAMMLTGTAVANVLVFLLLFLFVRVCGLFFLYGFSAITPMFDTAHSWLKFFDLEFFLPGGLIVRMFGGTKQSGYGWFVLYWIAVAVALFVISGVAYCRRRSETATKSSPNRLMQNLYRIGVTFPFLMIGVYFLITGNSVYLCLLCAFVAFLVWVIFELLTTKRIKNVLRSLPMLLIPVVLAGGYVASVYLARRVFYASTPERADIESVRLENGNSNDWENALLVTTEITESEILDKIYEAIGDTKAYDGMTWIERANYIYYRRVTVTLTSGRTVTYKLRSSCDLYEMFLNSAQIRERLLAGPNFDVESIGLKDFHEEQKLYIWKIFKEDFSALSDEQKMAYLRWNDQQEQSGSLRMRVFANYEGLEFYEYFYINSQYMPNAYRAYVKCHMDFFFHSLEDLQAAADRIAETESQNVWISNMSIVGVRKDIVLTCSNPDAIKKFLQSIDLDGHLLDYDKIIEKEAYRFDLSFYRKDLFDEENGSVSADSINDRSFVHLTMYLTFSEEDVETLRQIIASMGTMPIS